MAELMVPEAPAQTALQSLALVSTYVPNRCGIATFTKDLRDGIAAELGDRQTTVLAIDDVRGGYSYPEEVRLQIPQHRQAEYVTAADLLNINQINVAVIEHEFGIYGGRDGSHVLDLARRLRMPLITTLHTMLQTPSPGQMTVIKELVRLSDRLVVMSHQAEGMLQEVYRAPREKVVMIPHGIPDMGFVDPAFFRDQFGVEGRRVLLTFGLLGPGKGIETAIRAMPRVVAKHPEVIYIVLGATHPHVLRTEGNAYRNSLEQLVAKLKLRKHVVFHNRFVTLEELTRYLGLADIYITPYPHKEQITSGTLAYALGSGTAVVSTPFWYAEEMLAEGRGRLFPFGDHEKLADTIIDLIENETERHAIRKRAYMFTRPMVWKEVAKAYMNLASTVLQERAQRPAVRVIDPAGSPDLSVMPDINLDHFYRMTDDTGILQHAVYTVADRVHGYCADDNARALIVTMYYYDQTHDASILAPMSVYLSFLHHAFNREKKRFRNFMSYDRSWCEEVGSEDSHGRCVQALGTSVLLAPNDGVAALATRLFHEALEAVEGFAAPRAWAFSLIGLHRHLARFGGDTQARRVRCALAERLLGMLKTNATADWPWFEDILTYDNAKLPQALMLSGLALGNHEMVERATASLEWLVSQQLMEGGQVSLIGSNGWYRKGGERARFDQQPIDAMALVEACADAYRATGAEVWFQRARSCVEWFLGNNDLQIPLCDAQTGGCQDGLRAGNLNPNEGAESTLAWLIALLTMMDLNRSRSLVAAGDGTMEMLTGAGAGARSG